MPKTNFLKFIRFIVVGTLGFIIDMGITYLLKEKLEVLPYFANAGGFSVAVLNNYLLNKYWTFEERLQILQVITTDGVPSNDLTNNLFISIDNGHPIMGTLIEVIGSQRNGHEVMITGYNNNGTMEYFDPQTATYGTKFPS